VRRSGRDGGVFWTRSVRSRRERTRGEDLQMRRWFEVLERWL
jgi:hypothetical protein